MIETAGDGCGTVRGSIVLTEVARSREVVRCKNVLTEVT